MGKHSRHHHSSSSESDDHHHEKHEEKRSRRTEEGQVQQSRSSKDKERDKEREKKEKRRKERKEKKHKKRRHRSSSSDSSSSSSSSDSEDDHKHKDRKSKKRSKDKKHSKRSHSSSRSPSPSRNRPDSPSLYGPSLPSSSAENIISPSIEQSPLAVVQSLLQKYPESAADLAGLLQNVSRGQIVAIDGIADTFVHSSLEQLFTLVGLTPPSSDVQGYQKPSSLQLEPYFTELEPLLGPLLVTEEAPPEAVEKLETPSEQEELPIGGSKKRAAGPQLPPGFARKQEEAEDAAEEAARRLRQVYSSGPSIGPARPQQLPSHDDDSLSVEREDVFAPNFIDKSASMAASSSSSSSRAAQPSHLPREEWMMVAPADRGIFDGMGHRSFSKGGVKGPVDSSGWTSGPNSVSQQQMQEAAAAQNDEFLVQKEMLKRDKETQKIVDAYNQSLRSKSLLDAHSDSVRKQREEDAKKPKAAQDEWRGWDRDRDLVQQKFAPEKVKSMIASSKELGTRFSASSSGKKFL